LKKILVVAHFHQAGLLRLDTIDLLQCLASLYDQIILISTNLKEIELNKISPEIEVKIRENTGYDFYSYREGINKILEKISPNEISHLTLMNTSFVCLDVEKFKENYFEFCFRNTGIDAIGLTESTEIKHHIQSYLMTFNENIMQNPKFIEWWDNMSPIDERQQVIEQYEIGFSMLLGKLGFKIGALMCTDPRSGILNPTHGRFQEMLDIFGIIKIEVFKRNPHKLNLSAINQMIRNDERALVTIKEGLNN